MRQKRFLLLSRSLTKFIGMFVFTGMIGYMLLFPAVFIYGFFTWQDLSIIAGICVNTAGVIAGLVIVKALFKYDGSLLFGTLLSILACIVAILVSLPMIHTMPRAIMSGAYPVASLVLATALVGTIGYHLTKIIRKLLPSQKP